MWCAHGNRLRHRCGVRNNDRTSATGGLDSSMPEKAESEDELRQVSILHPEHGKYTDSGHSVFTKIVFIK